MAFAGFEGTKQTICKVCIHLLMCVFVHSHAWSTVFRRCLNSWRQSPRSKRHLGTTEHLHMSCSVVCLWAESMTYSFSPPAHIHHELPGLSWVVTSCAVFGPILGTLHVVGLVLYVPLYMLVDHIANIRELPLNYS